MKLIVIYKNENLTNAPLKYFLKQTFPDTKEKKKKHNFSLAISRFFSPKTYNTNKTNKKVLNTRTKSIQVKQFNQTVLNRAFLPHIDTNLKHLNEMSVSEPEQEREKERANEKQEQIVFFIF